MPFSVLLISIFLMAGSCAAPSTDKEPTPDYRQKAAEAKAFVQTKGYDQTICVLIDMRVHSGKKRLAVWDFAKDAPRLEALVSHGCCDFPWAEDASRAKPTFSNTDGSHCSSLGKYRIGARGYSNWGIHVKYLLHGLEPTNSNALARQIVLHSWEMIPDEEVYPRGAAEGWGCPAVSDQTMRELDALLKTRTKPVLLWIFNQ